MKSLTDVRAIIAVVAAMGCGSATAPPLSVTTYTLSSINGTPLPFTEPSTNSTIVSGSIVLIGSDSAEVNDLTKPANPNGDPVAVGHVGFDRVVRSGDTLVLTPLTPFAAVDTATLRGTQLVVRHHVTTAASTPIETQVYVAQ
ncbi:MAG TPA: hypothetical protein VN706_15810 [Gemmatimonadaceae bacterium]|nr:hypothetical protein [Gemmatimonadaceae bacterium]